MNDQKIILTNATPTKINPQTCQNFKLKEVRSQGLRWNKGPTVGKTHAFIWAPDATIHVNKSLNLKNPLEADLNPNDRIDICNNTQKELEWIGHFEKTKTRSWW